MVIPHRIHGAAIYGNMDPINIPQMDVSINIPAPWILWVLAWSDSVVIIYWCCLVAPQGEFFAAIDHWPWLFYASLLLLSLVDMFNHVHLFVPDLGFPKNEGSPASHPSQSSVLVLKQPWWLWDKFHFTEREGTSSVFVHPNPRYSNIFFIIEEMLCEFPWDIHISMYCNMCVIWSYYCNMCVRYIVDHITILHISKASPLRCLGTRIPAAS